MSDFNEEVNEQASDIEQIGGEAEYNSENDSDINLEGGSVSRTVLNTAKNIAGIPLLPLNMLTGATKGALMEIPRAVGLSRISALAFKHPIITNTKVNQSNIGNQVVMDKRFQRAVKCATNPVDDHGITQYEAFDLFNSFKECTEELIDELIKYFIKAKYDQNLFIEMEWEKRYGNHDKAWKVNIVKQAANAARRQGIGGDSMKLDNKGKPEAFTEKINAYRVKAMGATVKGGDTPKDSPFKNTDFNEGNMSLRYPANFKTKDTDQKNPTFLKLMKLEELDNMIQHLYNIKKIFTIMTDSGKARNFINPEDGAGTNAKEKYLKAMNLEGSEDLINEGLFDDKGDSNFKNKSLFSKDNTLNTISLSDANDEKIKYLKKYYSLTTEKMSDNVQERGNNPGDIVISLPPKFLIDSLIDEEKYI